ncbi:MAG TPA: MATE family efflux transporter [Syntrophorhabdaceae bacterium]|nr:MATE family efflux transporter [Syntrophorhabdaceae bacterium]
MEKKFGTDMTVGSIPRHLLRFSIPMLVGNLIQIGYSIVNTIWVGHLVGEDAVGAVGVSFPVFFTLIGLAMGISMASTILISQYYGAKHYKMVEKAVDNSFALALIIGCVLTVAAILSSDFLLKMMDTPQENFAMASSYLKITLAGFILFYLGLLINSILRGIGDTVTPLMFMSVGIGINAVLDPFLIGGFGPFVSHGLNGAAYATLISQAIAVGISILYLNRKGHFVAFNLRRLALDKHITALLFRIGLPSIVQQSLISISSMFVSTFVNSFGSAATNAFGAVVRVDMFAFMPAMSMSMAVAALTGQNLGAHRPQRVKDIFRWGVVMTSCITVLISVTVVLLSRIILIMFGLGDDAKVMGIGISYLHIVGSCYIFFGIMFISNGVINGAGHTIITMTFSLLSLWLVRVPLSWYLSKTSLGIRGIWAAVALSFLVTMAVSLTYYLSGRWKKSVIIKAPAPVQYVE